MATRQGQEVAARRRHRHLARRAGLLPHRLTQGPGGRWGRRRHVAVRLPTVVHPTHRHRGRAIHRAATGHHRLHAAWALRVVAEAAGDVSGVV